MIKPIYEDDSVVLFLGDCLEVLPELASASVDLILTDPPYGLDYGTRHRQKEDKLAKRFIVGDMSLTTLYDTLKLLDRLLKPDSHMLMFMTPTNIGKTQAMIENLWKVKNVIAWDK